MKFLATALMLLVAVGATAQITLTGETSVPRVGDVFKYHIINYGVDNLNVTHDGANQVWDMSAVAEGIMAKQTYISVAESTEPETPSNLVCVGEEEGLMNISEVYYNASSTGLTFDKAIAPSVMSTSYTNRYFLKFPLGYNQEEYTEPFEGIMSMMGQTVLIAGTANIKADGYGTLKLPYGTINNVLRIKIVYDYTYSMDFGGMLIPYAEIHDIVYLWYNTGTRHYIADYSLSYGDAGSGMELKTATLQYLAQDDIITSQKEVASDKVSIYPNPTQGFINISGTDETPDVKIYNLNGSLLQQEKSSAIDISGYATGVYLIDVAGNKYKVVKK
jgi:hypothetical protein